MQALTKNGSQSTNQIMSWQAEAKDCLRNASGVILLIALTVFSASAASAKQGFGSYTPRQQNIAHAINQSVSPTRVTAALPPTTMDSFVNNAGGSAETIYGDEGTTGIPPYFGFSYQHRINAGITGQRDAGLTTGHGQILPSASGADEFLAPPGEMSLSGANGGNPRLNNADATLNTAGQEEASQGGLTGSASGGGTPTTPSPGPGFYPIFMCGGVFAGWMSPDLVTLGQSDWGAALAAFARSGACDPTCALELLVETGYATPDQQAAMYQAAMFQ